MAAGAFDRLQRALATKADFNREDLKAALMNNPDTPESFSSFTRALSKNIVKADDLFFVSSLLAVQVSNVYIRYAGLALRYQANANAYHLANFDFGEGPVQVPIHIAKRIWDATPRTRQESVAIDFDTFGDVNPEQTEEQIDARLQEKQRASLDILCMMSIQGFLPDAKITTNLLLKNNNINPTAFIDQHPEFFGSIYGDMKTSGQLGEIFSDEIRYFEEWKGSLQNGYGVNPKRDERIFKYALFLDHVDVLSLADIYGILENVRLMFFFQATESLNVIIPKLKDYKIIGIKSSDYEIDEEGYENADPITTQRRTVELMLLEWTILYYNLTAFRILLDLGVVPDYVFRSRTIRASRELCKIYPLQCQILNTIIVECVKKGYGLDNIQLQELSFSPSTIAAVKKEYAIPAWQYMCKVRSGDPNPDMKEMARQSGVPLGLNKGQICDAFESMKGSDPSSLKKAAYDVNRSRIALAVISPADVASGRKALIGNRTLPSSLNPEARDSTSIIKSKLADKIPSDEPIVSPICFNADSIMRPIEDYPAIDRVTYSDGAKTWCFTSENFGILLDSGLNRQANDGMGAPIPQEILMEMHQKRDAIRREGLLEEPGSISNGIDQIFNSNPIVTERIYENESNRMLDEFYSFSEDYGIDPEIYSNLTTEDFQNLSDTILSDQTRIVVNQTSPSSALRDFASAVLEEIKNFKNHEQVGKMLASVLV